MKKNKSAGKPAVKKHISQKGETAPVSEQKEVEQAEALVRLETLTRMDWGKLIGFGVLLFFAVTALNVFLSLACAAAAVICCMEKSGRQRLGKYVCVPVVGLLLFLLIQGLAAIYTPLDELGIAEFYKVLTAGALGVILLAQFEKKHVRGLLWCFAVVTGLIALLSLDMDASMVLFTPFRKLMELLGYGSYATIVGSATEARVTGLYNDANVTGSIFALSVFVTLYLSLHSEKKWQRLVSCVLLGVASVSVLVSGSRGVWLCFGIVALFYLAVARGERLRLFILMAETAVFALVFAVWVTALLRDKSFLADIALLLSGLPIFAVDVFLGDRIAAVLSAHKRLAVGAVGGVAAAALVFVVAALNLFSPIEFSESTSVTRTMTFEHGEYTMSGDWDGNVKVRMVSKSFDEEGRVFAEDLLYDGPLEQELAFTVPDGGVVQIYFIVYSGDESAVLRELKFSNGAELRLKYTLLPELVAARLNRGSLFLDNSYLLRAAYVKDTFKVFAMKPIFGIGLASTEGFLTQVQNSYYESKYAHNHILQIMADTGIVGLAFFLMVLLGAVWLLIKRLRNEKDPLASVLLVCWVMMNFHSLMEINFSIRPYLCLAFMLLALMVIQYTQPIQVSHKKAIQRVRIAATALVAGFVLFFVVFGSLIVSHLVVQGRAANFRTTDLDEYMTTMERYIKWDVFNNEELKVSFINGANKDGSGRYRQKQLKYVANLRSYQTFTACTALELYYYLPWEMFEESFESSRDGINQKITDYRAWDNEFDFYRQGVLDIVEEDTVGRYLYGVLGTITKLEEFNNSGRQVTITLSEENQKFVDLVLSIHDQGLTEGAALSALLAGRET